MTAPDPTIKRGDWRTLAQLNGVVGICPETTQQEAASLLVEHLADLILAKRACRRAGQKKSTGTTVASYGGDTRSMKPSSFFLYPDWRLPPDQKVTIPQYRLVQFHATFCAMI